VIFYYEFVFIALAILAIFLGEAVSRTLSLVIAALALAVVALGVKSFDVRLATESESVSDEDRRFFIDARDGLRHLRLLLILGTLAALAWRLLAG